MIGIDLDNTIISYGEAFPTAAKDLDLERYGSIPATKHDIRQWLQGMDRNDVWTELQGHVYGEGLRHAKPFPGMLDCIRAWHDSGMKLCVISHKTVFPAIGPQCNLREAALQWMESQGVFDPVHGAGLPRDQVFFDATRREKVARIAAMGCSHFIDDLPEVFDEPGFPGKAKQCLFDPDDSHTGWQGGMRCRNWSEIQQWMQSQQR